MWIGLWPYVVHVCRQQRYGRFNTLVCLWTFTGSWGSMHVCAPVSLICYIWHLPQTVKLVDPRRSMMKSRKKLSSGRDAWRTAVLMKQWPRRAWYRMRPKTGPTSWSADDASTSVVRSLAVTQLCWPKSAQKTDLPTDSIRTLRYFQNEKYIPVSASELLEVLLFVFICV